MVVWIIMPMDFISWIMRTELSIHILLLEVLITEGAHIGYPVIIVAYVKDAFPLPRWYVYVAHMSME